MTLAELHAVVCDVTRSLGDGREEPRLERPPKAELGDYSTNAALLLAPRLEQPPREIAELVGARIAERLGAALDRYEVAGPGFVNLHLADRWFSDALAEMLAAGDSYGGGQASAAEPVCIEFLSANPTGPLTVAHGRHAAFGDALARILGFHGHAVTREYYINDYGSQVQRLGESVRALAAGEPVAEDGYRGDYVAHLVEPERALALDAETLAREAIAACLAQIRGTLERFDVHFDTFVSERAVHESGAVERAMAALRERGDTYTADGALWLRTSAHGDDKDRVLERSSGEHTYFAADIAYHQDKLARGSKLLIDVWGADHHGYVKRMHAAFEALGGEPGALEIVILQYVHLLAGSERAAMSKRAGEFVTLDELLDEIGSDAARFFLLQRSHDMTVDLDLDLAVRQSSDNPVFYVQYAHARIASMRAKAGVEPEPAGSGVALHPSERALIKRLLAFPGDVADAAERRAPHRIAACALDLAQQFTAFYRDCKVIGSEPGELERFRLALAVAAQRAIARSLWLLGVSAPDQM